MTITEPTDTGPRRGPRIREIYRAVAADHFAEGAAPRHAALLFSDDSFASEEEFLGDFSNEILHQDTCGEFTHEGVPLLAALAIDDRVPIPQRMSLVSLLFSIATVADRHEAGCRPRPRSCPAPAAESRARASVQEVVPRLLERWEAESAGVRLALTAIAAAFPATEAARALLPGLRALALRYPGRTLPGDYVRLAGTMIVGERENVLGAVEALTSAHWSPTARSAPLTGRSLHLLDQMLNSIRASTRTRRP
ncbi:hypothetical protein [Streptomyces erythrochromogenes]|uniref:hypothetical protein n=1 Tax=Streptomyces erythrochromogenes TaxID=285574 RepID=UPI0037CF69AF